MKYGFVIMSLLMGSAMANAQTVEVASGDWTNVPRIQPRGDRRISDDVIDRLHDIGQRGECNLRGLRRNSVDITVPFVLQFAQGGAIERVVIRNMGCPPLETLIASVVLDLTRAGEYRPTGENQERWYRSELSFVSGS